MKEFSFGSYWIGALVCMFFMAILIVPSSYRLQEEKDLLQEEYNTLQTQYDRDLSTCRTLLSDIQNRIQKGQTCYVDGGNNCE